MHATSSYQNKASNLSKLAIVAALHIGVVLALLQMRVITDKPHGDPTIVVLDTDPVIEPEPIPAPELPATPTPPIFVPKTEVTTIQTDTPPQITTTTVRPTDPVIIDGPKTNILPPPAVVKAAEQPFKADMAGNCAVPTYPAASARNGDTGTVGLALLIDPKGHVADAKVTSSSGFRELDRAAMAALSQCSFKPATTNGVPESAWGKIAYVWTLE